MSIEIEQATAKHQYAHCVAIRTMVFIAEQGYPLPEDFDESEALWDDYLLLADDKPAATARWRMLDEDAAKIGMIAVLKEYRGKGYGKAIVAHLTDMIAAKGGVQRIEMSAQDYALPFYEKLGYQAVGDGYFEGHIAHHKMIKEVN